MAIRDMQETSGMTADAAVRHALAAAAIPAAALALSPVACGLLLLIGP